MLPGYTISTRFLCVLLWSPDAATAGSPRGGGPSADSEQVKGVAREVRDGKLTIEDLSGGTFMITNGCVYGSLLSTPILNPPQSGILGMHKIARRPVAVGDKVESGR
jgi:pyruvate/2-oxoglutarate dehydrogenase complex dihydrolipoamide acyltransferase (E2) component